MRDRIQNMKREEMKRKPAQRRGSDELKLESSRKTEEMERELPQVIKS